MRSLLFEFHWLYFLLMTIIVRVCAFGLFGFYSHSPLSMNKYLSIQKVLPLTLASMVWSLELLKHLLFWKTVSQFLFSHCRNLTVALSCVHVSWWKNKSTHMRIFFLEVKPANSTANLVLEGGTRKFPVFFLNFYLNRFCITFSVIFFQLQIQSCHGIRLQLENWLFLSHFVKKVIFWQNQFRFENQSIN